MNTLPLGTGAFILYVNVLRTIMDDEQSVPSFTTVKRITNQGNSLTLVVTKECALVGLNRGDTVEVTVRKKQ